MRTWLRNLRVQSGMTMKDAGQKLGISESYYCTIENGERQRKMDIVLASGLATIFNKPLSEIVSAEQNYIQQDRR